MRPPTAKARPKHLDFSADELQVIVGYAGEGQVNIWKASVGNEVARPVTGTLGAVVFSDYIRRIAASDERFAWRGCEVAAAVGECGVEDLEVQSDQVIGHRHARPSDVAPGDRLCDRGVVLGGA